MADTPARVRPNHAQLFEVASEQSGYFTAAQAGTCGFSKPLLAHHARDGGRFIRVRHGLYRLREYPSSPREDVIAAWLAADRKVAVVSHESALDLLDLSDVVPDAVHLTVPRSRRYRRRTSGIAVHTTTRPLRAGDVVVRDGIRVTSAERSILDAAESGTAPEQIVIAVRQALERGMTTQSRLLASAQARSRRVERLVRDALQEHTAE
jgi:predicted transcriptional regulator of viral defense system